jgi:hypothetical protein
MDTKREIAGRLAEALDAADHMVLRDSTSDEVGNTELIDRYVSGEDHNLIVEILRAYSVDGQQA